VCTDGVCSYTTLQDAFSAAQDGSLITICGEWNQGGILAANNVTIRGTGNALLKGGAVAGKAGIVIDGQNTTIENLECSEMTVPDANGACIRMEGTNLTLRNMHVHDNEMGILTVREPGTVLVENSLFENNGKEGSSLGHNLYIGGGEFIFRNSRSLSAQNQGHEIKSRAAHTVIENSTIATLNGVDSYTVNAPNGGIVEIRNSVLEEGPNSSNYTTVATGEEGLWYADNSVTMNNNIIINDRAGSTCLYKAASIPIPTFTNNKIVGVFSCIPTGSGNTLYPTRTDAGLQAYPFLPATQ
jgi:hypothetical protein